MSGQDWTAPSRRQLMAGVAACGAGAALGASAQTRQLLDPRRQQLTSAMSELVGRGQPPGAVTLLAVGTYSQISTYGKAGFGEDAEAMGYDMIFRIASMTKPVAAVAAMILVEEGRLSLEEPVDRLLPELAKRKVLKRLDGPLDETEPARRPILVEDLLTLRMGMGAVFTAEPTPILQAMAERGVAVGPELPTAESGDAWIAQLGALPLMRQPGEAWMYDTGMTVLGVLIERASGQPLEEFMKERIFTPLRMVDTGFSVPADKLDRLPPCLALDPATGGHEVFDPGGVESRFAKPPGFPSASGGLVSTAYDYRNFAQMMLSKGDHPGGRMLSERSVAIMSRDHITPEQKAASPFSPGFWERRGWGYGVSVMTAPGVGDPRGVGWDGGYGTSCYWDAETGMVGVLMTQRLWNSPTPPRVVETFWRWAYEAVEA